MRAVFQLPAQHDFRGGRAARRQFGREPDPATVRRHARLDAGGAGGRGEPALNLHRRQPDHPIRGGGVGPGGADGADRVRAAVLQIPHVGGVPLLICFRGPQEGELGLKDPTEIAVRAIKSRSLH